MLLAWPAKDPDEVLDYDVDWSRRLDGDTIASSTFEVIAGDVVIDAQSNSVTVAKVWLSAGTLNSAAQILNRIVTTAGRTMDQTIRLPIRSR